MKLTAGASYGVYITVLPDSPESYSPENHCRAGGQRQHLRLRAGARRRAAALGRRRPSAGAPTGSRRQDVAILNEENGPLRVTSSRRQIVAQELFNLGGLQSWPSHLIIRGSFGENNNYEHDNIIVQTIIAQELFNPRRFYGQQLLAGTGAGMRGLQRQSATGASRFHR